MGKGIVAPSADKLIGEYVQLVRNYMRDHSHLNRLLKDEETGDRMLAWAIVDALDIINNEPPVDLTFALVNFPFPGLLVRGAIVTTLESVGILQTRNRVNYSDGGIRLSVSDKAPELQAWIGLFRNTFERRLARWKVSQNISRALGGSGVYSEYWVLSGTYGTT
jgi:hypothetical protein